VRRSCSWGEPWAGRSIAHFLSHHYGIPDQLAWARTLRTSGRSTSVITSVGAPQYPHTRSAGFTSWQFAHHANADPSIDSTTHRRREAGTASEKISTSRSLPRPETRDARHGTVSPGVPTGEFLRGARSRSRLCRAPFG
jgi:hypothetical protein